MQADKDADGTVTQISLCETDQKRFSACALKTSNRKTEREFLKKRPLSLPTLALRLESNSVKHFSVSALSEALEVPTSDDYAWYKRTPSQRGIDDTTFLDIIRSVSELSRKTYGSPRIHAALVERGFTVGENRVTRIMR